MDDYMLTRDINFCDDQTPAQTLRDTALSMRVHLLTMDPHAVDLQLSPRSARELSDFILAHTAPPPADVPAFDGIAPRGGWLAFAVIIPVAMLATYRACALIRRVLS